MQGELLLFFCFLKNGVSGQLMKRQWDIEELIEHFTLMEEDLDFLANKPGPIRLGYALLFKGIVNLANSSTGS